MAFSIDDIFIQRVSNFSIQFGQFISYPLNPLAIFGRTGDLNADDQNNDGFIQRGETVDNQSIGSQFDLNNATVLGVGSAGAIVSGILIRYPVIVAQQGGNTFFIYPNGQPDLLTQILQTASANVILFRNGRIGPGGQLIPCFARGTQIMTDRGNVAVEDLAEGDLVETADRGLQPIRWIGGCALSAADLAEKPDLRPVRIRQGALGADMPSSDLLVSPQHRVLVRSRIAQKMFGTDEVLVAAKQLCQLDGIDVADDVEGVEYFHILFDQHEVVLSNGAETEALYTGPEALRGVGEAALEEILQIFPQLRDRDYEAVPARALASGRMARKLAVRHAQSGRHLVQ